MMKEKSMTINRRVLFFPALAVGVLSLVLAINLKPDVATKPAGDKSRVVDIVELTPVLSAPIAVGFGQVVPKVEWKAIAEVSGAVVYKSPMLEKGKVVPAGTELLRIDPLDYELKLSQAKADLTSSETQLAKLDQQELNLKQTLTIEKNRLGLSNNELQRRVDLQKRGLSSKSDVDVQQQSMLSQKKLLQDIENQLALIPDEKAVAKALVKVNQAKVQEADRSLSKTRVVLPVSMRISEVDAESNQVVNMQQTMVVAHGMDLMEVDAQLSIHDVQLLASSLGSSLTESTEQLSYLDNLTAKVYLSSGNLTASWPARVARVSDSVDQAQATAGVILEIEQAANGYSLSDTPILVKGMFVKAEIEGAKQPTWLIPERALHGDKIYLMDDEDRLLIQKIKVIYRRDNQVAIEGQLSQGDRLVVNDLLPAIAGMKLRQANSEQGEGSSL
jgi:multidrug efflux pump subunit AcrA (membrane-fusion protein)